MAAALSLLTGCSADRPVKQTETAVIQTQGQSVQTEAPADPAVSRQEARSAEEQEFFSDMFDSFFGRKRELVVGKNIDLQQITEFWWTYDASTDPPHWQRYCFQKEDGIGRFSHETREGRRWPLTPEDATVSGSMELTDEEWEQLCSLLEGGVVRKRTESDDTGDAGPWMYLYWTGDQSIYQEFTFVNAQTMNAFEEFCVSLKKRYGN